MSGPRAGVRGALARGALAALLALPGTAAAGEPPPPCDEARPLSVLGMDTGGGTVLFTAGAAAGPARLVELRAGRLEARTFTEPPDGGHFAGSVGPGPIFALRRCGDACVAAERWEGGAWRALGEPLPAAQRATFALTYDREGRPWAVVHRPADAPGGWVDARAFRLEASGWLARGRLAVLAPGVPAAAPAPWLADGVVSGTGLFRAAADPATWARGLPALPPGKKGQVVPLSASAAAYLAADGAVFLSPDAGATWTGTRWRPWGVERSEVWTLGSDYDLDLPLGSQEEPLPLAWFDRRPGRPATLALAEVTGAGDWTLRAQLAPEVEVAGVGRFELVHFLRTAGGTWLATTDCFLAGGGAALAVQEVTPAGVASARAVAIRERR